MIWKSAGDGEKRKYDFDYDNVNRLMKADFNQYSGSTFDKSAGVDFSMKMGDGTSATSAYDANGNIKAMTQTGLKINTSSEIDNLAYTYNTNSNKLLKVVDAVTAENKLGDFYNGTSGTGNDYSYDANGNLISDANKKITSITYNHLNLPSVITITGKGTITYTYDAAGNKLKKVTLDNTVTPSKTTTTLYIGGVVYENDVLQFIGHEEGRIRFLPSLGGGGGGLVYDYFLKDHLGNVRMVLTEEQKVDPYPPASMETAQATTEEALYANLPQTRTSITAVPGYPADNYTNPNNNVAKVNGSGNKIGPSIILKVMAGDKFNIRVSSWYKKNGATPQSPNSIATDLIAGLIGSLTGTGGPVHGAITSAQLTTSGVIPISTTSFLNSQPAPGTGKPKAYINWVLLDEQFKYVSTGSGAEQVGNDLEFKVHTPPTGTVTKNGYLYVFVSNETPNIDVFFDNLQVTHIRGPILEETHYYPFGLTMEGISSKALSFGNPENKYKWNSGTELNSTFDINLYETFYRSLDPQIGRFWQIDPMSEAFDDFSPYVFALNNSILLNDPNGLAPNDTLPEIKIMGKSQKELDTENGQVMGPQSWFMRFLFGQREWNGYAVNEDGYLTGGQAITALEVPDFGSKKSATRKAAKKVATKYLVYQATKKVNGRLKLYIGKAKQGLKGRYSKKEIAEIEARVIEGLDNLPDNATALGVEQAIVNLNGGVNRIAQATSNIRNPTLNRIYRDVGEKWLNTNIPDWKEVFKFQ